MANLFPDSVFTHPQSRALVQLALQAGAAIMEIYQTDFGSIEKADGSPVTVADQAAEKIILDGLATLFPDIPVVAEEAVEAGHLPVVARRYFLVDPLDGTREFIARNGEFTVNIALIDNKVPVFGVVFAPALEALYWGGALPVTEENDGKATEPPHEAFAAQTATSRGVMALTEVRSIQTRRVPQEGVSVLASRSHLSEPTKELISRLPVAEHMSVGSSLKLCWLAEGKADFYPRLGPTMQWDIAAGDAVLRAAGGLVLEEKSRRPLSYQVIQASKEALLNPDFLAFGDPEMDLP